NVFRMYDQGAAKAEGIGSRGDDDHLQAGEAHSLVAASLDVPSHHRVVAGQASLAVGEARAGVDVARARLEVVSLQILSPGHPGGEDYESTANMESSQHGKSSLIALSVLKVAAIRPPIILVEAPGRV